MDINDFPVSVLQVYVSTPMCAWCVRKSKEGYRFLGSGMEDICESPQVLELNPGHLLSLN